MVIYTVGHSNHPIDRFLSLLTANGITAVADVRSKPFSRRFPQFNKERLAASLSEHGIAYVYLGKELGARPVAETLLFKQGIDRVLTGAETFRVALMCAEKNPADCHRSLLVSPALEQRGASIAHILADGSVEIPRQQEIEYKR